MTKPDLDHLERLCERATPGPWGYDGVEDDHEVTYIDSDGDECNAAESVAETDAQFIAAARTALPALVARVRELEGRQERALYWLDTLDRDGYLAIKPLQWDFVRRTLNGLERFDVPNSHHPHQPKHPDRKPHPSSEAHKRSDQ